MNIGIIGPPGAGKSKFAKLAQKHLESKDPNAVVNIVDRYAQKLQRDTGLALGPFANWSENYMVAGYRRASELKTRQHSAMFSSLNNGHVITVGTIFDTMYYMGLASRAFMMGGAMDQARHMAVSAAMGGIGVWFRSDWDYDLAIALLPQESYEGEPWVAQYANDIPEPNDQELIWICSPQRI
jgi:ABC-type branched-subunit amino acid transport system ATPase component